MSSRVTIIALCALLGALIAGYQAPVLLQNLFDVVQRYALSSREGGVNSQEKSGAPSIKISEVQSKYEARDHPLNIGAVAFLGLLLGAGVGNMLFRGLESLDRKWDRMALGDKVTLFIGIFAGIIASMPFWFVFNSLGTPWAQIPTLFVTIGISAVAIYALRSMQEVLPWHKSAVATKKSGIKILDTNVIIDGRIYDVARAGFLEGQIYIPKFVLEELQYIADSSDPLRRQRGRRGLDVLRLLQSEFELGVGNQDRFVSDDEEGVDSRLVRLAKALGADLVTNDMNLYHVAQLQDVRVLNINDLAMALKPNVLPRENLNLVLVREGNQPGQGVGYLDDGTMVVVENGRRFIGETAEVVVTQVIQTERGKMIFAEVPDEISSEPESQRRKATRRADS